LIVKGAERLVSKPKSYDKKKKKGSETSRNRQESMDEEIKRGGVKREKEKCLLRKNLKKKIANVSALTFLFRGATMY